MNMYRTRDVQLNRIFPLKIERKHMRSGQRTLPHTHEFTEIGITLSGSVEHRYVGKQERLSAGSVYIFTPGEQHALAHARDWSAYHIYFIPAFLGDRMRDLLAIPGFTALFIRATPDTLPDGFSSKLSRPMLRRITAFIGDMERTPVQGPAAADAYRLNTFVNLLLLLCGSAQIRNPAGGKRFREIVSCIEERITSGTKTILSEIMNRTGYTRNYLSHLFSKTAGEPISMYILRRKILRSIPALIRRGNVTDAAHEMGFFDTAHYSRYFKKITGESPRDYCRKMAASL
ncbi:MAG: AraC family transcriptional regulator [Spirochaetes bacterium]|nr:AraC family transcriptional regulator [Spirochaetota bacterium]